jgi:hypothetical protein
MNDTLETVRPADVTPGAASRHPDVHHDHHPDLLAAMAAAAAGDSAATWDLLALVDRPVRRIIRAEVHRLGGWIAADDMDGLVLDGALTLASLAGAWKPDGAPPWVWARDRLLGIARHFVDVRTGLLDDDRVEAILAPPLTPDPGEMEWRAVLRALAARRPDAAALEAALTDAVTERDAEIWLEVEAEQAAGNRSAAVTAAARAGLSPTAVRKITQRVRASLADAA